MTSRHSIAGFGLALTLFASAVAAQDTERTLPEVFTGVVVDAGGSIPGASSARFTLHIDEYTTDAEARELLRTLAVEGPDGLIDKIEKIEKGWIRIGTSLGYPVSVTRSLDVEGGRVIRVATDRPIMMFEVYSGLRSQDHPFGVLEIQVPDTGKGEGRLIAAADVHFDETGSLEIESLGTRPFRLVQVRQEIKKKKKRKQ